MKRIFDVCVSLTCLVVFLIPIIALACLIKVTSPGPAIFWSERVGRNNVIFKMPKFRTMRINAPLVATHLMVNASDFLTPVGVFLRRTSLDELPQLWSILIGDMSFVGPRPALYNQDDLIALRTKHGVNELLPGLTGWAQVNGRDELSVEEKVEFDVEYLIRSNFLFDMYILWLTFKKVASADGIKH